MAADLLAWFPEGFTPRPEQARLLRDLAPAVESGKGVLLVEAPPGVGKSHVAMTLARWSGDAYLLTSQKLLQDQYEREFGGAIQLVKGRDNYPCELYPPEMGVTTSFGKCHRPRGPKCQCPYVRAKTAALSGPIFCTNTAYFATLRQWHGEHLPRRRLLVIDEAHNLEAQLTSVFTVSFSAAQMTEWFGRPLPRLASAEEYRALLEERLEGRGHEAPAGPRTPFVSATRKTAEYVDDEYKFGLQYPSNWKTQKPPKAGEAGEISNTDRRPEGAATYGN
jgi:Rad3-related DNA helicase